MRKERFSYYPTIYSSIFFWLFNYQSSTTRNLGLLLTLEQWFGNAWINSSQRIFCIVTINEERKWLRKSEKTSGGGRGGGNDMVFTWPSTKMTSPSVQINKIWQIIVYVFYNDYHSVAPSSALALFGFFHLFLFLLV